MFEPCIVDGWSYIKKISNLNILLTNNQIVNQKSLKVENLKNPKRFVYIHTPRLDQYPKEHAMWQCQNRKMYDFPKWGRNLQILQ